MIIQSRFIRHTPYRSGALRGDDVANVKQSASNDTFEPFNIFFVGRADQFEDAFHVYGLDAPKNFVQYRPALRLGFELGDVSE